MGFENIPCGDGAWLLFSFSLYLYWLYFPISGEKHTYSQFYLNLSSWNGKNYFKIKCECLDTFSGILQLLATMGYHIINTIQLRIELNSEDKLESCVSEEK